MTEMVHAELQFEPLSRMACGWHHDARVQDEQVELLVLLFVSRCEGLDVAQVGKIELLQPDRSIGRFRQDTIHRRLAFFEIAAGECDAGALERQHTCRLETDAGVGAGDDGLAAGLVWNVIEGPFTHESLLLVARFSA